MAARTAGFGDRWHRRTDMVLRTLAAIPIGYAAASLWGMVFARLLPTTAAEASITGQLVAIALCAGAAMWAFAARSGWRAVWTLALAGAVAAAIAWTSIAIGGRL